MKARCAALAVWAWAALVICALTPMGSLGAAGAAGTPSGQGLHLRVALPRELVTGGSVSVSGEVLGSGSLRDALVRLEQRMGRRWVVRGSAPVDPRRRFTLTWRPARDAGAMLLEVRLVRGARTLARSRARRLRLTASSGSPRGGDPGGASPTPRGLVLPAPTFAVPPTGIEGREVKSPPAAAIPPGESGGVTVTSDGGPLSVHLDDVSVVAPAGAIAAGQTLSLSVAAAGDYESDGAPSIGGGPYILSTSQGEPSAPVRVSFEYDPALLASGSQPLIVHDLDPFGMWVAEATTIAGDVASTTLETFSPIDIADDAVYYAGVLTGNRSDLPEDCSDETPTWITDVSLPDSREQPLPICVGSGSDATKLELNMVNNRGYAQLVEVGGADFDVGESFWSDSLEGQVANALAAALPAGGPQMFILAPGESATLVFDRPPAQPAARDVYIDAKPKAGVSAFAEVAWSILATARDKLGNPVDATDCMMKVVATAASQNLSVASGIDAIHHCADTVSDYEGLAKKAFQKLSYGLAIDDFFYKLQDLEADVVYPASVGFTIPGTGLVNDDIEIEPHDLGVAPSGETTVRQLTASGGVGPYEFHIAPGSANAGAVPTWVTLSPDGTLTIAPPAGTERFVRFGVYVFDATGEHSPFDRDELTVQVWGAGSVWAWGTGYEGELGNAAPTRSGPSTPVPGIADVEQVAGATNAAYALRSDGTVWRWGLDPAVKPADPLLEPFCEWAYSSSYGNGCDTPVPTQIHGLSDIVSIAPGYALRADGTVWSLPPGGEGVRGNPEAEGSEAPAQVVGLSGVKAIAGGYGSGYALLSDGTVWAWGENGSGQLGDGLDSSSVFSLPPGCGPLGPCYSSVPVKVVGLSDVVAIAAGQYNAYALSADGRVWAWGDDSFDQIGNGGSTTATYEAGCRCYYPAPSEVQGLTGVEQIAAGLRGAYALVDGHVWAWGDNTWGELGDGEHATGSCTLEGTGQNCASGVPLEVPGLAGITDIVAGGGYGNQFSHAEALGPNGEVWAWGANVLGEVTGSGGGSVSGSCEGECTVDSPIIVAGLPPALTIGAGGADGYAVVAAR